MNDFLRGLQASVENIEPSDSLFDRIRNGDLLGGAAQRSPVPTTNLQATRTLKTTASTVTGPTLAATVEEAYKKWQDAIRKGYPAVLVASLKARYEQLKASAPPVQSAPPAASAAPIFQAALPAQDGAPAEGGEKKFPIVPVAIAGGVLVVAAVGFYLWRSQR